MDLTSQPCKPCDGGTAPLEPDAIEGHMSQVPAWTIDDGHLVRNWLFKNFRAALAFTNDVGDLAEDEGHHPDIHITSYRNVRLDLWTHAIGGLSDNDFIMAAKIDRLWRNAHE